MATAKIITSNAGKHRVHFEFKLDHIARFTQDVQSKHAEGSPEIKEQFDAYASDYVKGFLGRGVFIEFQSVTDAVWTLERKAEQKENTHPDDQGLVYYDCVVSFPVKGTVRLVRDVHGDDDALTLGRKLQELSEKLECQFIADAGLAPVPVAQPDAEAITL